MIQCSSNCHLHVPDPLSKKYSPRKNQESSYPHSKPVSLKVKKLFQQLDWTRRCFRLEPTRMPPVPQVPTPLLLGPEPHLPSAPCRPHAWVSTPVTAHPGSPCGLLSPRHKHARCLRQEGAFVGEARNGGKSQVQPAGGCQALSTELSNTRSLQRPTSPRCRLSAAPKLTRAGLSRDSEMARDRRPESSPPNANGRKFKWRPASLQ